MQQPGLDGRHRDRNGEISRKHGNTRVRTLRKIYGPSFAKSMSDEDTLAEVLERMDEASLSQLLHDHQRGRLADEILRTS